MGVDDPTEQDTAETKPIQNEEETENWKETNGSNSEIETGDIESRPDQQQDSTEPKIEPDHNSQESRPSQTNLGRSETQRSKGPDEIYCSTCGAVIKKEAEICPECGVRQGEPAADQSTSDKDRVTAGVLALILGGLGAHKFYLRKHGQGILYLFFSWTLIPLLVGLVEGIIYLTKTDEEFQQRYAP